MILGTKSRYAVMAMVELAGRPQGKATPLAELADAQEMTVPYLEQIFAKLRASDLVKSVRGPGGGYVLARGAEEICISDIIEAVNEPMKMTRCNAHEKPGGCMSARAKCLTHDLWEGLERNIHDYLQGISLADVRNKKTTAVKGLSGIAPRELQ